MFTGGISKQPDNEALILELLSQILGTDKLSDLQSWLIQATDAEKERISDMIRAAFMTEQQVQEGAYTGGYYEKDEFLENRKSSGAPVDRLVVEDSNNVEPEPPTTKLPDINQTKPTR